MSFARGRVSIRNESRQEVCDVKLITINWQPSTPLAVCAPVSGVSELPPASATHVIVGHAAVGGGLGVGTPQIQAQRVRVQGRIASTYGLKAKGSVEATMTFGDVRGVPPRGRPV
jgi:hypothetical protein